MKLPRNPITTILLCAAFALTGCSDTYHIAYGGAYKKAIKQGKTEMDARRIAEAAGKKADDDEDTYYTQQAEQSRANLKAMEAMYNPNVVHQPNYQVPVGAAIPAGAPHVEICKPAPR